MFCLLGFDLGRPGAEFGKCDPRCDWFIFIHAVVCATRLLRGPNGLSLFHISGSESKIQMRIEKRTHFTFTANIDRLLYLYRE